MEGVGLVSSNPMAPWSAIHIDYNVSEAFGSSAMPHALTWMNLGNITLSNKQVTEKYT